MTHGKSSYQSVTTAHQTRRKDDPIMAALSVVVPLICGRNIPQEELAYIWKRVSGLPINTLAEALEELGDTADRVGNPIAAIRAKVATILKARRDADGPARLSAEIDAVTPEQRAANRKALEQIQRRLNRGTA